MHGVGLSVDDLLDEHLLLIRTEDVLRAEHSLSAGPSAIGGIDVVVFSFLIKVAAFQSLLILNDILLADEIKVLVELTHLDIAYSAGHIHLSVIEEHARVVVDARQALLLPAALGIGGGEQPAACIVAVDEQVELPVVILHRASPHAACIGIGAAHQVIVVGGGELCERLCTILPVHEVFRLQNRSTGEVVHRRRHHIIGIAHADDVGIGEVGTHNSIGIAAVAQVGGDHILEVGMRPVHLIVVGIPVHARLAAGFLISAEGRHHLSFLDKRVDIEQTARARERHRDVSVVVEQFLEGLAPLRRRARGPRAIVARHPVAMFVVVALAGLLRTPVHLGNDDWRGVHHRHLLVELPNLIGAARRSIATAIPAAVVVNGIADVVALNGIGGIVGIVGLPTRARSPDDAREAIRTNLVDDGLEVVVQRLRIVLAVGILQRHRLVGELDADLAGILTDGVVLRERVPHREQVFLIVVAHLQIARTNTRRTHHDIHAVIKCLAGNGEIERLQIVGEARRVELPDVGLARGVSRLPLRTRPSVAAVRVVGPRRVHVQTEHVAMGLLESDEEFLKVVDAALAAGIVVRPAPASAVEPGAGRVHHAMQHHMISVCVYQPATLDVQRRQGLHALSHQGQRHQGQPE